MVSRHSPAPSTGARPDSGLPYRGTATLVLIMCLAIVCPIAGQVFPMSSLNPAPEPGTPTLGDNGDVLDPYRAQAAVLESVAGCKVTPVDIDEMNPRCADDDGCTFRVSLNRSAECFMGSHPVGTLGPYSLSLAADGAYWITVRIMGTPASPLEWQEIWGVSGDDTEDLILQVSQHCYFLDDYETEVLGIPVSLGFTLKACRDSHDPLDCVAKCTLRIDD